MKNRSLTEALVFDLDGTLINSAPDVRRALNHMLAQYNCGEIEQAAIYDYIGWGAEVMIVKAFATFHKTLTQTDLAAAKNCYLAYYRAHPVVESYVYDGVNETITMLHDRGIPLGICTNKPSVMTHLVLDAFGLKKYFSAVVAGDDAKNPKPHGQHIHDVLKKMQITNHGNTFMIGDSDVDQNSAQHACVPFIGVTYGYSRTPLIADNVIHHFKDLSNYLAL